MIEVVMVMGILAIFFAAGVPVTLSLYQTYQLNVEQTTFGAVLVQARSLAMANVSNAAHGVYIDASDFVLFEGGEYETRDPADDVLFDRVDAVAVTGAEEIVFDQLSGRTASTTLTLTSSAGTRFIYINEEGRIQY